MTYLDIRLRLRTIWHHAGFQKYFRNASWLFVSRIASMAVSFVVAIWVARYLGPDSLGIINYAVSLVGIFSFLAGLGIDSILYRDLVNEPEKLNKLMGTAFWLKFFGTILAFLGVFITMLIFRASALTNLIILVIAASYIFQAFGVVPLYFQAKVKSKNLAIVGFIGVLFLSSLKVIFILTSASLVYFALVLMVEPIFYAVVYWIIYRMAGEQMSEWKFDKQIAKKMLAVSWPLMFTSAFAAVYSRIDQVMIGNFLDTKAVGIYSVASLLSEYWYFVPLGIINSLVPAIINGKKTGSKTYRRRLKGLLWLVTFISLSAAVFFTAFADRILLFFYGADFVSGADVLKIYIWGGIGMSLGFVVNQLLIIENKTKIIFIFSLISMVVNVILNLILIPRLGMPGAALATLISYSIIPLPILFIKY